MQEDNDPITYRQSQAMTLDLENRSNEKSSRQVSIDQWMLPNGQAIESRYKWTTKVSGKFLCRREMASTSYRTRLAADAWAALHQREF